MHNCGTGLPNLGTRSAYLHGYVYRFKHMHNASMDSTNTPLGHLKVSGKCNAAAKSVNILLSEPKLYLTLIVAQLF